MHKPKSTSGLRHVALFVKNFEACVEFYTQLLNMRIEWQPDADNVYLTSGNDNLALHRAPADFKADRYQKLDHIGFIINDIEQVDVWYEFLKFKNVFMKTAPRTHRDGARSFYCTDPDDNTVQVIYHPPLHTSDLFASNLLLAEQVGQFLKRTQRMLVTAESCTGGQVAYTITSIAGSACWFERSFVTYANIAKQEMLGVSANTLKTAGAVSEQTAREMAEGALKHSHADVSLAITGIAGPDGSVAGKPVGTVWFAWAGKGFVTQTKHHLFAGNRLAVRDQAVEMALQGVLSFF